MKRIILILLVISAVLLTATWMVTSGSNDSDRTTQPYVKAEKGNLVELALAVGRIEPRNEIEVKSKISGVIQKVYAEAGDYVRMGDPLFEIRPDPTPLELAEAKRSVERGENNVRNLQSEMLRVEALRARDMISVHEYQAVEQRLRDAEISLQLSKERLELLESGRIIIGETLIESVVKAPSNGYVLEKMVNVGDPVVPLTSYQAGTPLMTLAEMDDLLFKGTVDEIDVGKMQEGMLVDLRIGALPGAEVTGELTKISLKATQRDNSTVFPVEVVITDTGGHTLRAGYSANANVIIQQREDVLLIPERVVTYNGDKAVVELPGKQQGERIERHVRLGLSDAIMVEVLEGLDEGESVLERPARSLSSR